MSVICLIASHLMSQKGKLSPVHKVNYCHKVKSNYVINVITNIKFKSDQWGLENNQFVP